MNETTWRNKSLCSYHGSHPPNRLLAHFHLTCATLTINKSCLRDSRKENKHFVRGHIDF